MALSTLKGYREILDRVFRPEIGEDSFEAVLYSRLAEVVADNTQDCKKKTYNNIISAVRTAFTFGYKDLPGRSNPALTLPSFRITTKDRPKVDPDEGDRQEDRRGKRRSGQDEDGGRDLGDGDPDQQVGDAPDHRHQREQDEPTPRHPGRPRAGIMARSLQTLEE